MKVEQLAYVPIKVVAIGGLVRLPSSLSGSMWAIVLERFPQDTEASVLRLPQAEAAEPPTIVKVPLNLLVLDLRKNARFDVDPAYVEMKKPCQAGDLLVTNGDAVLVALDQRHQPFEDAGVNLSASKVVEELPRRDASCRFRAWSVWSWPIPEGESGNMLAQWEAQP